MKRHILNYLFISTTLFTGCNHEGKESRHYSEDMDGHEHEHSDEIIFTPEQAEAVGLIIEEVSVGNFSQVIKTSGQIQTPNGDESTVAATSNGTVSFFNSSITEGVSVKKGETIVLISSRDLLDGDPATKAKIAYEAAIKEYQRAEILFKDKIMSAKEYEQAQFRYETARTSYEAQASNITKDGVKVVAPISGYIRKRIVNQGEYVTVGQPIAIISQNRHLQLRAEVSERYFKDMKNIRSANFKTSYGDTYKLSDLNGHLISFGKTGETSFYIPVTFEFDNIGDIIPGSFVEIYLLSAIRENVISIPVSALTEEQGLYFVYLQLDEEGYRKQEVSIGHDDGERVEILSGLNLGDRIVTKGVYQVKLASTSSIIPEGHTH